MVGAAGKVLAGTATALAGAALGVAGYTVTTVHRAHRTVPAYDFTPFEIGVPADDVEFRTGDGLRLTGWWLDRPDSEWVLICCHGHQGSKADLLGIGPGMWRAGHSVLVFDFRGCGTADAGPQSLAHAEQADLRAAIDLAAARRPDAKIGLIGFSMGAATSILVGAHDARVRLFVLDSPFARMSDVLGYAYRQRRLPEAPLLALAELGTRLRHKYRFGQVRPVDVMPLLAPRPVLLIHGDRDRIIPVGHAYELRDAAAGPVQLVIFDGVEHCGAYFEDRPAYLDLVDRFIASHSEPADGRAPRPGGIAAGAADTDQGSRR